ncbi:hypothetical protein [Dysgonomonas sp. 25]|uniref:hypothetical protein n=1 Tax=Dysgonomonas sp. 25 TaxID=2302933 RepID=UPI0013D09443|nr:hypothetical protein [Dysgonomonas sp. 25]
MAVLVFFTGAGVTVMSFCCSDCRSQVFFMDKKTCCTIHHEAESTKSCCSTDTSSSIDCQCCSDKEHCSAKRYAIDIDSSVFKPHINIPFEWVDDGGIHTHTVYCCVQECSDACIHLRGSPPVHPRSYLSIIRVLII